MWNMVWHDHAGGCYKFKSSIVVKNSDIVATGDIVMKERSAADSALEVDDRFPHGSLPSANTHKTSGDRGHTHGVSNQSESVSTPPQSPSSKTTQPLLQFSKST
jgi:hypothetical protein